MGQESSSLNVGATSQNKPSSQQMAGGIPLKSENEKPKQIGSSSQTTGKPKDNKESDLLKKVEVEKSKESKTSAPKSEVSKPAAYSGWFAPFSEPAKTSDNQKPAQIETTKLAVEQQIKETDKIKKNPIIIETPKEVKVIPKPEIQQNAAKSGWFTPGPTLGPTTPANKVVPQPVKKKPPPKIDNQYENLISFQETCQQPPPPSPNPQQQKQKVT